MLSSPEKASHAPAKPTRSVPRRQRRASVPSWWNASCHCAGDMRVAHDDDHDHVRSTSADDRHVEGETSRSPDADDVDGAEEEEADAPP